VNGRSYVESIDTRVLGGNEHVLPRESALPHGSPGLLLVAIKLRSICQFNTSPRSAAVAITRVRAGRTQAAFKRNQQNMWVKFDVPT